MDSIIYIFAKKIRDLLLKSFSVVGGCFSLFSMLEQVFPTHKELFYVDLCRVVVVLVVSFVLFLLWDLISLIFRKHNIKSTDRFIRVSISDILSHKDGTILVGINDFLVSDANRIGKNSIHDQLLKKYGGDWLNSVFIRAKQELSCDESGRVPNGSVFTASSPDNEQHFAFIVMSSLKSDAVPESSIYSLYQCLTMLFSSGSSFRCRNNRLYIPVLGTGATALPHSKQKIIELICFSFINSSTSISTAVHDLIIDIRIKDLKKINLLTLHERIGNFAGICHDCPGKKYSMEN